MELGRIEDIMNQEGEFDKREKGKPFRRRDPKGNREEKNEEMGNKEKKN